MSRLRATFARSDADRDFHRYLAQASSAVRAALDVCGRASRGKQADQGGLFRKRQARLARAERLLRDIGHLEGSSSSSFDVTQEARALCSWLESRERLAGVSRPSRRGQEYQERLVRVLHFLGADAGQEEDTPPVKQEETTKSASPTEGVLWQRAQELARQQGEGDNDAYVQAIFQRLLRGMSNG